jgi:hypothetical protein
MKAVMIAVMLLAAVACERERRDFKVPNGDRLVASTQLTQLRPGAPGAAPAVENTFIGNAYALSEGKRL